MSSLDIGPSTILWDHGLSRKNLKIDWWLICIQLWLSYHKDLKRTPWHRDMIDVLISSPESSKKEPQIGWRSRHWIAVVPKIVEQHVISKGSKNESNKLLSKLVAIRLETCRVFGCDLEIPETSGNIWFIREFHHVLPTNLNCQVKLGRNSLQEPTHFLSACHLKGAKTKAFCWWFLSNPE